MYPKMNDAQIEKAYGHAKEAYAQFGVDVDKATAALSEIPISVHCWQGDDVVGFEGGSEKAGGGTMVTGNYLGRARTIDELRADFEKAMRLLPGKHRINLHASYADTGAQKVDRNAIDTKHFASWADWAKANKLGVDFNPTYFGHPKAEDGFTLSHQDEGIRSFWVEHGIACRKIGAFFGQQLNDPCVTNIWIPDGFKDIPVDRNAPRQRLKKSLDEIMAADVDRKTNLDAVECKLFGIGSESCVVGSHEFYMGYAIANNLLLCLDAGHFHPTEVISDKITSILTYLDEILLHVSRGVRWDSDHVVVLSDELRAIAEEIIRNGFTSRVHIGLDFFDASINRIAAWVTGTRAMRKALLLALLEPTDTLRKFEADGDYTSRLSMLEELKSLPFGAVWDHYCLKQGVPVGAAWIGEVKQYEADVLSKRD